jgi:hypothetical protein
MRLVLTKAGNQILKSLAEDLEVRGRKNEIQRSECNEEKRRSDTQSVENMKLIELRSAFKPSNSVLRIYNSFRGEIVTEVSKDIKEFPRSVSLKDVLKNEVIKSMKHEAICEKSIKLKNFKNQDFKLRTPLKTIQPTQKIDYITEKTISNKAEHLINYISNKQILSPKFLNNLTNYNENRLMSLDKICQRLMNSKERPKQTANSYTDKLNCYRLSINDMDDLPIVTFNHIDKPVRQFQLAHEVYKDKHWNDTVKRLHNPSYPKKENIKMSSVYEYYSNGNSRVSMNNFNK